MEQNIEVEENYQKSGLIPLSQASTSLIRIDAISINLAAAMDNPQDADLCDHFSIRGYVAEMREKNINACYPFSADDDENITEEQKKGLPPLDVVKFKQWDCYNCLREIEVEHHAKGIEKGLVSSSTGSLSKGSCSVKENLNGAAKGKGVVACTEFNRDENLVFSRDNETEKNNEVVQSIADGSGGIERNTVIVTISTNIEHLESNGNSCTEIGQVGTSNVPNGRRTEIGDSEIRPEVGILRSGDIPVDDVSSESSDEFAGNVHHDKFEDSSSKTIHLRPLKVRLLTELLGSGGNAENDRSRTTDSADSASDFCDDLAAQTIVKWNSKGKRKTVPDKIEKHPLLLKKTKISKEKTKLAKRNCMAIYSEIDENSAAIVQQKNPKVPVFIKKKHKQTQHESGYPTDGGSLMPAHHMPSNNENNIQIETHIAKTNIGTREVNSQGGESNSVCKSAPDLGSEKGLMCDLNEKIDSPPHILDVQNDTSRFQNGSIQHPRELIMFDTRNSDPQTNDEEKGNEDFPIEIIELLAKNKYERRRHEFERNYFSQERANEKRDFESMVSSSLHRNGLLNPYQVEDHYVRNPISQITANSSEYFAPINSLSHINESRINLSKTEEKRSDFSRYNSFFDSQGTQSSRVNYQNYQWPSGYIGSSFSPPNFRYSTVPNYLNFPQAGNFRTQIPESSGKSLDINFVNDQYKNFQKQNRDIGFESFQNLSTPFASKHRGFDLNAAASGSLDIQSNEAIPAMQLLSLMDPGLKSNNILSSNGNNKMISKPIPTHDHYSRALDKPMIFPKEPFGRALGGHDYNPRPPLSAFGPFASPFPKGNTFQGVPLKFREKKKGPALESANKKQKSVYITSGSLNNQGSCSQRAPQYMSGHALPTQSLHGREFCVMSRNPAEFSTLEPGNIYTIDGKDLKFEKKSFLKGKKSSANVGGRKREGVAALTATNAQ